MSVDELLKQLQQEYIQSIPDKIHELQSSYNEKDIQALLNSFHKFKGSGKTYGINEITILGQFFETWIREKGDQVLPFVPQAISIMDKIHQARTNNLPYDLSTDSDFKNLENIK